MKCKSNRGGDFGSLVLALGLMTACPPSAFSAPDTMESGGAAVAEEAPGEEREPGEVVVVDSDLRELLLDFGKRSGLRVVLSDGVSGRVQGARLSLDPDLFLGQLSKTHGLDFFRDGDNLVVSRLDEAVTHMIAMKGFTLEALERQLAKLGIETDAASLRAGSSGLAIISGPPRYVAMVELVADSLAAPSVAPKSSAPVRLAVYRGGVREDYLLGGIE